MATQQDLRNPGEKEYEENFDFERHERELQHLDSGKRDAREEARVDQAASAARDSQARSVRQRETAPSWDTKFTTKGQSQPKSRFSPMTMLKKRSTQWLIGGLIALVAGLSAAVPATLSAAFVHLKELSSDWGNKNNHSYFAKRNQRVLKKRIFTADQNCKIGIKCRFKKGVSDKEIQKYKDAGLKPNVIEDGNGVKHIKSFAALDLDGKPIAIDVDNFDDHYKNNIAFRGMMDRVAKPKSMLLRGATTLKKVFNKFGIKRNREIPGEDDKERTKNFRVDEYSDGNETEKANKPPADGENPDEGKINDVDNAVNEAAAEERKKLVDSNFENPPTITPDVSNLDLAPDEAVGVAKNAVKDGVKGAVTGVFSVIDKACSGYGLIRAVVFGAKLYKVLALVKYAGIFLTLADKLKAGDAKPAEIGFIGAMLMKPSAKKESKGKTFFQSEGFNQIFQGKIADHRGLARYSNGTPFLRFLQGAKKTFENLGANKTSCKHVKSWYGQLAIIVAGLSSDIFTGGWGAVAGVAANFGLGMIISTLTLYVVPLLVQYAAGTVAPDVFDLEGGYGVGNAFAAGMGALGFMVGRANGGRALTKADAAVVNMEADKEMAFQTAVENQGKNPFSIDSPTSITSQLAIAAAPYASAPIDQTSIQSLASIIVSPFNLFASSVGNLLSHGANAQSDIARGGEYCADDEYTEIDLAVDSFCNPIPGETSATITDPKYDPDKVLDYMVDNGHVDEETGDPKSDDFKKYLRSCVDEYKVISPDGGGTDVGEDIDTRWCYSKDEKFNFFRFYLADGALDESYQASVDGTLGDDDGTQAANNNNDLNGTTYPNGKLPDSALCELGDDWPGQKIRCDAVDEFSNMAAAYKNDLHKTMIVTDSYRTYDQQVQCKREKGDLCATPGTSNHGCGAAIDFGGGIDNFGSPEYEWMKTRAATWGWIHPAWADQGGSKPEPWHWEYGTNGDVNNGTCIT